MWHIVAQRRLVQALGQEKGRPSGRPSSETAQFFEGLLQRGNFGK